MINNIDGINAQDLNKEIITPEGKSMSLKEKVAEKLNTVAETTDNTTDNTTETEKPHTTTPQVQNILVSAASDAKKAEKSVSKANKAVKDAEQSDSAVSKYRAVIKIDKAEKDANKYFNTLGYTQDENKIWDWSPTIIPKKEPKTKRERNELADNVIRIYVNAASGGMGEGMLQSVKEQLKPYIGTDGSLGNAVKKLIQEKSPEAYNALYSDEPGQMTPEQKATEEEEARKAEEAEAEEARLAEESRLAEEAAKTEAAKTGEKTKVDEIIEQLDKTGELIGYANETYDVQLEINKQKNIKDRDEISKSLNDKQSSAKLKDFLPRYAISRYLDGEFGDISKNTDGTPKNPESKKQADKTLAYFILDKIGAGLINSSMMMRGLSPTQKSALQKYNETQMDNALKRDDNARNKIIEEEINNIIKDSDSWRSLGVSKVKLAEDELSRALEFTRNDIHEAYALKVLEAQSEFFKSLSEDDKNTMIQCAMLLSTDGDDKYKSLARISFAELKRQEAQKIADKEKANAEIAEANYMEINYNVLKDYSKEMGRLQYEKAVAELDSLQAQTKLTNANINDILIQVKQHKKELEFLDTKQRIEKISGYVKIGTDVLNSASSLINAVVGRVQAAASAAASSAAAAAV